MRLKPVGPEHAERLAEAHASAFERPWSAADIRLLMEGDGAFALAAETPRGALAGFVLCRAAAGEAEILTLAVDPRHRRRGLGLGLTRAAAELAAASCEALFLEVAEDNPGALALYHSAGFEPVGRRPGYYARPGGEAVDAIVMRQALNR